MAKEWVLWGFHPRYGGPLGVVPLKLAGGALGSCRSEAKYREMLGWMTAIYRQGTEPLGLRLQCKEKFGKTK